MYVSVNTGAGVAFEWNDGKAASNLAKHGVSFELAKEVWNDPFHVIASRAENSGGTRSA
jgi:uncharacterized DUF497 family protein